MRPLLLALPLLLSACGGKDSPGGGAAADYDSGDSGFDGGAGGGDGGASEDLDGDGYSPAEGDCDEGNAAVNPAATDVVGDGIDQNCDGVDGFDGDGDGHAAEWSGGDDCDDEDPSVGAYVYWYEDADGDGYGDPGTEQADCDPPPDGVDNGDDCDDTDPTVHPGAEELCDGVDNDCDPTTADNPDGVIPPVIERFEAINGGLHDFGTGGEQPSVALDTWIRDDDGDIGTAYVEIWHDDIADGAVDTSGGPSSSLAVSLGDEPCGLTLTGLTIYIPVGTTFDYNTVYEFAMVITDAAGNPSAPAVGATSTPREDGSDGDGAGG